MRIAAKKMALVLLVLSLVLSLAACAKDETQTPQTPDQDRTENTDTNTEKEPEKEPEKEAEEDFDGKLISEGRLGPDYADGFTVEKFKGGYRMLTDTLSNVPVLVVPEGMKVPEDLDPDVQVLQLPLTKSYVGGSNIAAMAEAVGAGKQVTQVSMEEHKWHLPGIKAQMADGTTQFVGDDYELVAANGTQLAIINGYDESLFNKLRDMHIVVVCEQNTLEKSLFARLEWVKAVGVLFGHEEEAIKYFDDQVAQINEMSEQEHTGKIVGIGGMSVSSGKFFTRKGGDFQADYVRCAGGKFAMDDVEKDSGGSLTITAEDFYLYFKDADVVVWSFGLSKEGNSLELLKEAYPPIVDFKAWQNGQIYFTSDDYIQSAADPASIVRDIFTILHSDDPNVTTHHIIRMPETLAAN